VVAATHTGRPSVGPSVAPNIGPVVAGFYN
jgi:hypothetical protein